MGNDSRHGAFDSEIKLDRHAALFHKVQYSTVRMAIIVLNCVYYCLK